MKTKAEMTQEYSLILLEKMNIREPNDSGWMERIAKDAAKLANVVQAEIEKNVDKSRPDVLNGWQPDWSKAPKGTIKWVAGDLGDLP